MDFEFDAFGTPEEREEKAEVQDAALTPKAPEPKPEPKAEEAPKDEATAPIDAGTPVGDEPDPGSKPSDLREQVIAANARAKEAQKALEDQREELDRINKERNKLDEKLRSTTDAISQVEAAAHPQVTAITAPFEDKLGEYCEKLDGRGRLGNKLRQLAPQLINQRVAVGDPGEEGFEKRQEEFTEVMKEHFGERDWENTADIITDGARVAKQMRSKVAEITADAEKFRYDAQVANHMKSVKQYEELEKMFGTVPPEVLETNPDDPRLLLNTLMEEIPQLKEREGLVKQHLRRVNLPLPPVDPKSLEGMTDEDQALHLQERVRRYEQDRMQHAQASYEGYIWRMAGPLLAKMVRDMRDRATSASRSTPAPRDNSAQQTETPEEQPLSPADFQIDPNPAKL